MTAGSDEGGGSTKGGGGIALAEGGGMNDLSASGFTAAANAATDVPALPGNSSGLVAMGTPPINFACDDSLWEEHILVAYAELQR